MRFQPVVIALAVVGLFAGAVLIGYVGGRAFLAPTASSPRPLIRPVPRPSPEPPSVPAPPEPVRPAPGPTPQPASPPVPEPQKPSPPQQVTPPAGVIYRVQVGAFLRRENAEARAEQLRQDGFDAYINQSGGLFKVQVGAFSDRDNAIHLAEVLRAKAYEVLITP